MRIPLIGFWCWIAALALVVLLPFNLPFVLYVDGSIHGRV